jgi:exodeoxyribonuclease VII large subunit
MSDNRQIFSLEQVCQSIKKTIEARYNQLYWVKAEMHKINRYPSGHAFPELVQKEADKILAQMTGTIWKQNYERIDKQFISVVKEPLKEGSNLLMQVKVTYSEVFGLSLHIVDIDPNFSLGELQRERDETLKRLQKEGLTNLNQQLSFPLLPKRIAIISADSSKGLSDFMKVIEQNPWGYRFFTMLFPAYLQGDVAVASIQAQLVRIEKVKEHFDCVAIVRGGGGEVGMTCYNNFDLCKAIATFPLPVLSGIGHSTNMTVAEMVSFRSAITPTELGDFLIQVFHEFNVPVNEAQKTIRSTALRLLESNKSLFQSEIKHFKNASMLFIQRSEQLLQNETRTLQAKARKLVGMNREQLNAAVFGLKTESKNSLKEYFIELDRFQNSLQTYSRSQLEKENRELDHLRGLVRLLDPKQVLKRGFSITTHNGVSVNKDMKMKEGILLQVQTYDFMIKTIIQEIDSTTHDNSDLS